MHPSWLFGISEPSTVLGTLFPLNSLTSSAGEFSPYLWFPGKNPSQNGGFSTTLLLVYRSVSCVTKDGKLLLRGWRDCRQQMTGFRFPPPKKGGSLILGEWKPGFVNNPRHSRYIPTVLSWCLFFEHRQFNHYSRWAGNSDSKQVDTGKLKLQRKMDRLRVYFPFSCIFHFHVSLPEGKSQTKPFKTHDFV